MALQDDEGQGSYIVVLNLSNSEGELRVLVYGEHSIDILSDIQNWQ
jgi:hypothetical protein